MERDLFLIVHGYTSYSIRSQIIRQTLYRLQSEYNSRRPILSGSGQYVSYTVTLRLPIGQCTATALPGIYLPSFENQVCHT